MYLKILTSQCISNLVSRESKAFPLKDKHAKKYIKQGSNPGGGGGGYSMDVWVEILTLFKQKTLYLASLFKTRDSISRPWFISFRVHISNFFFKLTSWN